jgi:geranylgeranyl reductase family protein
MDNRNSRMEKRSDVLVIGGGPSGLRLAGRLAAQGLDVRVLEKKAAIGRNVVCTGIIGREVFAKFGIDRSPVIREIGEVRLVSPSGASVTYRHPKPFACVVDREKFDAGIAASAVSAGAGLELEHRVEDLSVEKGGVRVTVRNGRGEERYSAALAVIASGVEYALQKKAGLGCPRDFLKGAQAELPLRRDDSTSIFVGRTIAPGGFAWSVPAGESVRVGLLTRKDPKALLRRFLETAGFTGTEASSEPPIRTKAVAQGVVPRTTADRILSVGEAAGQIKTTTGGGISYGLLCADLAAETILRCFERSSLGAQALAGYEVLWRKAIQREIVIGYQARKMCSRLSDRQVEGVFHLARTDGIIPIIRETADFDRHSALIFALFRRLSFMRPFRTIKDTIGKAGQS